MAIDQIAKIGLSSLPVIYYFENLFRGVCNRNRHLGSIVLGVKKEYRNKGIARNLLDKAQDWSRKNGISRLELTVAIKNTLAIKRYLSSGFIFSGIRTGSLFINGELIDEYYMNKEI
ncbi:GNAT family N-acetyltransferase [Photorhabdus akhurstii]|uniref:GNAT family N-acetyltransferase n=1 Tax=Photorhabdus akhurstii TaxID=171438 RepID=UPI001C2E80F6|nr:GNAT family N-acetyltransferase [Photorhabdus akhurstii]